MLLCCCLPLARAQETQQSISGTVRNEAGEPLEGVSIRAENTGSGAVATTTSDNKGVFAFSRLPHGSYRLTFTHIGFSDRVENYVLNDRPPSSLAVSLQRGASIAGDEVVVVHQRKRITFPKH